MIDGTSWIDLSKEDQARLKKLGDTVGLKPGMSMWQVIGVLCERIIELKDDVQALRNELGR